VKAATGPRVVRLAVFGDPVAHSLSPAMHRAALRTLRLRGSYDRFRVPVASLAPALRAAAALGFRGVNLTIPLKEAALGCVDRLTVTARRAGAVNTVTVRGGRLEGHSTDGEGLLRSLRDAWPGWSPRGGRIVLCGAGGAARSVAFALADGGAKSLTIVNRSRPRAVRLARTLGTLTRTRTVVVAPASVPAWRSLLAQTDLLVNATSVGMHGGSPVPAAALRSGLGVVDLIYTPAVTPLLKAARRAGAPAVNGAGMLVHQGALALERWTGRRPPVTVMKHALMRALAARGSIGRERRIRADRGG
jgi:shikimate dehydrogenase